MRRYEALDAWRGVAALLVAAYHLPVAHALALQPWFKTIELFVDFFFVLSGFVICHAYGERLGDGAAGLRFLVRRLGRVWPLHALVLGILVALELGRLAASTLLGTAFSVPPFTETRTVGGIVTNLLMIQSFNLHPSTTWNLPAWSISVEFYTYVAFAGLWIAFGGRTRILACVCVAAGGALVLALLAPNWLFATSDFGMFRALYGFFVGVLACRLHQGGLNAGTRLVPEPVILVLLAAFLALTGVNATSLFAPLVFACVVLVFAREEGALSAALRTRPLQALGAWSYSIYLVHPLVYYTILMSSKAIERVTGIPLFERAAGGALLWGPSGPWANLALGLLWLVPVIAMARITRRVVEKPGMAWFGALAERIGSTAQAGMPRRWPSRGVKRPDEA